MDLKLEQKLRLRKGIAMWSDQAQPLAAQVAVAYQGLLPKRIGMAQLSGLNNMAQSAPAYDDVKDFVAHQGEKAERAGRTDVKEYWDAVAKVLVSLEQAAWTVASDAGLPVPPKASKPKELKAALNEVYLMLAQEWVQHLIAHSLMIMPKREAQG